MTGGLSLGSRIQLMSLEERITEGFGKGIPAGVPMLLYNFFPVMIS